MYTPATDTRVPDTSGQLDLFSLPTESVAVSPLIGGQHAHLRPGDDQSAPDLSTPATATTPGTSGSTTAIRTTGTRTTSTGCASSADRDGAGFSIGKLLRAWTCARRRKRSKASIRKYEAQLETRLADLHEALAAGTYTPGRSICFAITRPKPREVWAATVGDRVAQHALYNEIRERFERAFIADSCACIPGRGTLYSARRLEAKVRSITRNGKRAAYYLKCDIANFFVSIDKPTLWCLLERRIPEPHLAELARAILFHDPRVDVEVQGDPAHLARVPDHKSLFRQPADRGLPIGNLMSQFGANVYLNELDQFVKHRLRARHYVRYVDDLVILHEDPAQLNAWRAAIDAFLQERLRLRLNPAKTIIQPIARGVDFVGQVITPRGRTLRRRTLNDALYRLRTMPAADVYAAANSYLGLARQTTGNRHARARIANAARRRGHAVDHQLTKVYP